MYLERNDPLADCCKSVCSPLAHGVNSSQCLVQDACWKCLNIEGCIWFQCETMYPKRGGYFWFFNPFHQDGSEAGLCGDATLPYENQMLSLPPYNRSTKTYFKEMYNMTNSSQCNHRSFDGDYSSFFWFFGWATLFHAALLIGVFIFNGWYLLWFAR